MFRRIGRLLAAVVLALPVLAGAPAMAQAAAPSGPVVAHADFATCLGNVRSRALNEGIEPQTLTSALAGVRRIDHIVRADRAQARPSSLPYFWGYASKRLSADRIRKGQERLAEYQPLFDRLYAQYGVRPQYLVALWSLETNYGSFFGSTPVLDALTTMACDARRSEFFAGELLNALRIVQRGEMTPPQMRGSWAGAMGHMQFMPTTFINYAVDGDGDGRVQLWQSVPDAMASAANYLHSIGWNREERWGREVRLPANLDWRRAALDLDERAPLTRWRELGVRQATDGALVPALDIDASLILPAGKDGPAFLVYENFHHVMHWNRSRFYALTVGLLADRIAGEPPLAWTPRSTTAGLRGSDMLLIQQALIARGYELGKADGRLGGATRAAIRRFELAAGLPADGWPDPTLKKALLAAGG